VVCRLVGSDGGCGEDNIAECYYYAGELFSRSLFIWHTQAFFSLPVLPEVLTLSCSRGQFMAILGGPGDV